MFLRYLKLFMASLLTAWVPSFAFASAQPWQLGFQPPASPVMEQLNDFHNLLLVIITGITLFVLALIIYVCVRFNRRTNPTPSQTSHNTLLEIVWTLIPVLLLVVIAIPSFKTLFYMEQNEASDMTIKVIGRQWYWQYEYPDHGGFGFDSYMLKEEDLKPGQKRLLEVDNPLVVPVNTKVRVLITGGDVMHSWAIPALGVKKDAVPGHTNETWFSINTPGMYYGQCSELCGVGHGFMPIALKAVSKEEFNEWVKSAKQKFSQNDILRSASITNE